MATRGVNECTIMGTLGKDAELKEINDKFNVIRLSLAVNETWKDKQSGQDKEKTEWIPVEIHNRKGLAPYLLRGAKIMVRGQFTTRQYEKDGQTHYASCVTVGMYGDVQFCGGNQQSQQRQKSGSNQQSGWGKPQQPSNTQKPPANEPPMDFDDDIPF